MNPILLTLILSCAGAVLYRLGGKEGFDTKFRDIGVSLVFASLLALLGGISGIWQALSLIPCFGLSWAALTTYRYFLPKPKDYTWPFYALHGFMVSAAMLPYAWTSGHWLGFGIRCILNSILVGLVSHFISWDDLEEGARGLILTATIPLLLI